jgi:hypothetical protein
MHRHSQHSYQLAGKGCRPARCLPLVDRFATTSLPQADEPKMQRMFYSAEGPRSVDERDVLHVYQGGERLGRWLALAI